MRRLRKLLGGTFLITTLSVAALFPVSASAFSAYGAGTADNPYRIDTCSQLQEINNNLSAHYALVSDINCNGATISSIDGGVGDFSGTFDGQNHTITNFINNGTGLFHASNGATFKNLNITNATINASDWSGGLVGVINGNTIIDNVHVSSLTIGATYGYTGGLVGLDSVGTITINKSSFNGSIANGSSYEGGLVGAIDTGGSTITDSYATGTFNMTGDQYNGGVVGALFGSATLTNVYSAFALNVSGAAHSGGLIGTTSNLGSIVNSFAANTISGSGSVIGAVTGIGSITTTNVYYDSGLSGGLGCSGDSSNSCNAVNVSNVTPSYFKNNTSNGPMNLWDFSAIWKTNNSSYPTLQNEAAFVPVNVPNSGDANGDGISDRYQANVASIKDANGVWSTITIPSSDACTLDSPASVDANSIKADSYSSMVKYDAFTVYCPAAGTTVPVTIIYDKQYNTANAVLRYYNPLTKTYSTVQGAVFGTTVIGGITKTTVTYNLVDGGGLDSDGVSNGVIIDPVAMVINLSPPNTGYGAPSKNTPVIVGLGTIALVSIAGGLSLLYRRQRQSKPRNRQHLS